MYTKIFIGAIVLGAVVGGGYAVVEDIFSSPQKILFDALQNLSEARTIELTAGAEIEWSAPKQEVSFGNFYLEEREQQPTPKTKEIIQHTLGVSLTQFLDLSGEKQKGIKTNISSNYSSNSLKKPIQANLEIKGTTEKFYLRVQGIQDAFIAAGFPLPISGIENIWMEVSIPDIENNPFLSNENNTTTIEEKLNILDKRDQILGILKKYPIVKEIKLVGKESLGIYETHHIQISLDEKELIRALEEIGKLTNPSASFPPEIVQKKEAVIKSLDVWVDTKSHEFRSITITLNPGALETEESKKQEMTVNKFDIKLSNMQYNQPFAFTPPDSSKKIEDVFKEVFEGLFMGPVDKE